MGKMRSQDSGNAGTTTVQELEKTMQSAPPENTMQSASPAAAVYSRGSLHAAWPEGTPFESKRHVDRHGPIVRMEVWNDSAEWLPARAGLAEQAAPSP